MGRIAWVGVAVMGLACAAQTQSQPEMPGGSSGGVETSTTAPDGGTSSGPEPGTTSGEGSTGAASCDASIRRDVAYAQTDDDPALTTLDVFPRADNDLRPIVLFVHGGGWVGGDKATHEEFPNFGEFFADAGVHLVTTNYRLVGDPGSPDATYVEQATDLAHAVGWVHAHAAEFCGDPERIVLVGHSAGAHLVALVATDPRYLGQADLAPSDLAGIVALDVNAYDIPWAMEHGAEHDYPAAAINLPRVFGSDPAAQVDASPITFVGEEPPPPQLIVSAPVQLGGIVQSLSRAVSERYVDALVAVGAQARFFEAVDATHGSLVTQLGLPGHPTSEEIRVFLGTVD